MLHFYFTACFFLGLSVSAFNVMFNIQIVKGKHFEIRVAIVWVENASNSVGALYLGCVCWVRGSE